jgi:hypothetical protein
VLEVASETASSRCHTISLLVFDFVSGEKKGWAGNKEGNKKEVGFQKVRKKKS